MLLHKSVEHDSRVRREARALAAAGHQVTVLHMPREKGEHDGFGDGFEARSINPPAWVRRLPTAVHRTLFLAAFVLAILRLRPDVVHAHDAAMLAPGLAGAWATGSKLVYDSHELATGVPYRDPVWARGIDLLERFAVPRSDAVLTVSPGIAEELRRRYGLRRRPAVVRNLPDPAETDEDFEAPDIRQILGLPSETPLVLHLGAVARERGGESLVVAMRDIPGAHLLFLGADDPAYASALEDLSRRTGVGDRVHFRPSVPVSQIRAHVRQADVGVSLLEDTCENHRLALPNKVFEYLASGLPVVVSDLPEMRAVVEELGAGATVDTAAPQLLGDRIAEVLSSAHDGLRPSGTVPAWDEESARLRELYAGLQA
jgi:glycosyltransferase involved in cell wall biosynthesis